MDIIKQPINSLIRYLNLRVKRRRMKRLAVILTGLAFGVSLSVYAHNVGQAQTSKFFHPDTVQMLVDRATGVTPGGAGLRVGDVLTYVIESVPAPNGASLGSAGYITDYIPPGLEVVGAAIVDRIPDPSKIGGYDYISESAPLPGQMEDGFGRRGSNYAATAPPPAGTLSDGVIAHVTQDTGIFYSTDSRTQRIATPYDVTGPTASKLAPGQAAFLVYNDWDYQQFDGLVQNGNSLINGSSDKGNTPVFIDSSTGLLTGLGSAVAGPDSCYTNDIDPSLGAGFLALQNTGPWQRISYPGSLTGCSSLYVATAQGSDTITGVTTFAGTSLSSSSPLPANTNAVRWAIGERAVGSLEHVTLSVRITDLAAFTAGNAVTPGYTNQSSVFGGDASGSQDGKDNVYRYLGPSHANNNAQLYVLKQAVATSTTATGPWVESNGNFVKQGDFVKYRLTYLNGASASLSNVVISDVIDANSATYISSTTGAPFVGTANYSAPTLTWPTIATLAPGNGGTFEVIVEITATPKPPISTNTINASSDQATATASVVSTITTTGAPAELAMSKTVTPTAVAGSGDVVTYTVVVDNNGGALASEVKGGGAYPAAGSVALVIGDRLPKTGGTNDILYQGTTSVVLTDLDTGTNYDITAAIAVDTGTSTGDVFWIFENDTFPAGHPRAGEVFDFVNSQITITFTATANTSTAGIYYNDVDGYVGMEIDNKVRDIKVSEYNLAPVSIASPNFIGSTKVATDINAGAITPGDIIQYDFNLTNNGVAASTTVVMTDVLPANSAFVVGSVVPDGATIVYRNSGGASITPVADGNGVDITVASIEFSWGVIAISGSVTPSFNMRINDPSNNGLQLVNQGSILVDGSIIFLTDDPAVAGATDATTLTIVATPDFTTSSKTVLVNGGAATTAVAGDTLTYTITVNDTGHEAGGTTNLSVTDTVDLSVFENIVLGADPAGWISSGPDGSGLITWYAANFDYGDTATLTFTADVKNGLSNGTALDNSVDINSDQTSSIAIQAPTITVPVITVSGIVFDDINDNNTQDGGDGGLSGVTVALRVAGFVSDVVITTTDANGAYTMTVPLAGDWEIVVTDTSSVLSGRTLSTGGVNPITLTLVDGQTVANNNFGYNLDTLPATIDGNIFDDVNGNGVDEGVGDAGLVSVTIDLKNSGGFVMASTTTDVNGDYSFANLAPGTYTVEITNTGNILTGRFGTGPATSPVTVAGLLANTTQTRDFGYQSGFQIGNLIFSDDDNDNVYDAGETGIGNVTVELRPDGGGAGTALQTTTTDVNGSYVFTAVADGNYDVVITDANSVLGGLSATGPVTSTADVVMASADQLGIDFGYNANPNLAVTKTVNKGVAGFNEAVIYTMTITNTGGALTNAVIRDVLPSTSASAPYTVSANSFQYLSTDSVTLNGASFTIPTLPTAFDNTPEWSGFDLPAASTLVITFSAFTGLNEGINYNGVRLAGSNITTTNYPDLVIVTLSDIGEVTKTVSKINGVAYAGGGTPTVIAGDVVTYRATLSNTAAAIAQEISQIVDVLPAGFVYVAGSSNLTAAVNQPGNPITDPGIAGQTLTWSFSAPRPGTTANSTDTLYLEFDVTVPTGVSGTFTNNATMTVSNDGGTSFLDQSSGDVADLLITQFSIGDLIFSDVNGNGVYEPGGGDTGVVNVTVELRAAGSSVALQTISTDASGNYIFPIDTAGTYDIVATDTGGVLLGYTNTTGGTTQTTAVSVGTPSVLTIDFGYQPPAAASGIQGTIFQDADSDGIKDVTETTGYAGITVNLYNVLSTLVATATTDASGAYNFTNLAGGLYTTSVATAPAGAEQTTPQPLNINLPDATTVTDNDMGYQPSAVITGVVFADINNNGGAYEAGTDILLSGVTVNLKLAGVTQATTTTDGSGVYTFSNVSLNAKASETYDVDVDQAAAPINGSTLTTGNEPQSVVAQPGVTTNATDIGYLLSGSVSGTIYNDLDGDNTYVVANDAPLSGVTVELYDATGVTLLQTTTSVADGSYIFNTLADASYTIRITAPAGLSARAPASGSQTAVVAGGANTPDVNFGLIQPPDLAVTKTHAPAGLAGKNDVITYTITVTNTGGTATGVTVTDYLPSDNPASGGNLPAPTASLDDIRFDATTSVEIDGSGVTYTEANPNNEEVSWDSNPTGGFTLANGQVLVIVFTATVRNDDEGLRYNSVAVDHDGGTDWNPDIDSILVVKDWGAVKSVTAINGVDCVPCGVQDIYPGDTVTYEIVVTNKKGGGKVGKNPIETISIVDTLPIGFKYITGTTDALSPGNTTPGPFTNDATYDPVISPVANASTNEVLTWTFNHPDDVGDGVTPNEAKPHLITGPDTDDTATLSYDVIATDSITPNKPTAGLNYNNAVVSANIMDKDPAPLVLALVPVAVNVLSTPSFTILKTSVVTNDPVFASGGSAFPHAIPGAEILYTVRVINTDTGSSDPGTVIITDAIPANTELFVGDLNAGAPFIFTNGAGAESSTLTCPFVSLATTGAGDCIEFFDAGSSTFEPTPDYDSTVNSISITPTGTFAGASGGTNTYFEFKFRVRIK